MGEHRRELEHIWTAVSSLAQAVTVMSRILRDIDRQTVANGELLMSQSEQTQTLTAVVEDLRGTTTRLVTDTNAALNAERNRSRDLQTNLDSANTSLSELRAELDKDTLDDAALEAKLAAAEAAIAAAQGNAVTPEILSTLSGLAGELRNLDAGLAQVPTTPPDTSGTGTPAAGDGGTPDTTGTGTAPAPDTSGTATGAPGGTPDAGTQVNTSGAPADTSGAPTTDTNEVPGLGTVATPDPNAATGNAGGNAPGLDQSGGSTPNP